MVTKEDEGRLAETWTLGLHLGTRTHSLTFAGDYAAAKQEARRYIREGFEEEREGSRSCTVHTVSAVDVSPAR